ncbi:MAG: phosphoethanolamine transferase [Pseudomonadota bacterium]|nr:phosphoethanolamine transferase [Pseudomonadota bacterium]
MRILLRPATLYLLLTYLALSAVPFVPMLLGKPLDRPWQVLGVEFVAWVAAWAVFKRPACFHWLLIPAFLALPTEVYLITYYGQGISTHHLGIIAETSPKEALEFLGQKVWLMAAVLVGVVAWWISSFAAARGTRELDWADPSRWVALGALAIGAAVWGYGAEFGIAAKPAKPVNAKVASAAKTSAAKASAIELATSRVGAARSGAVVSAVSAVSAAGEDDEDDDEEDGNASASAGTSAAARGAGHTGWKLPPLARWAELPLEFDAFAQSWPFGLVARGVDFYKERTYLAELGRRSASFHFGAHQAAADGRAETVVLVLGESSRYDRWSLNGYARDTNPLLKQEANLVTLPDVITAVSATRLSVPVIISRKPAMQSLKDGFSEKSFITAYKEAGFKTFWISNQISFGQFDTPVSVFAKEADVIEFLNLGGFTNNSNYDDVLFAPFKNALADKAVKKLIVVHTLGSHWNYSHRYPKQFDQWQPSLYGIDKPAYTNIKIKPQLNNSYDSSIVYTDWILAQLIGELKQTQQRSAMLYVSDHGQTLYDNSCNLAFHGHNTEYEFHVPAFVWYSAQYQLRYPDKVEQLGLHSRARLATENMFHTLLDVGDIRYAGEKLEWSFLNRQFKQHKRYVDSYGWTNYDNATLKGDCHEVIDKGKPLKQEK